MQYSQGSMGRVFTLRLEDDDRIPECIETFAREHNIKSAFCTLIGGIDKGNLVVGPEDGDDPDINPMLHPITQAHEAAALGTIFTDETGSPVLHMHAALGRDGKTRAGCVRPGLDIWLIGEVVIFEILDSGMVRRKDDKSGFTLLEKE